MHEYDQAILSDILLLKQWMFELAFYKTKLCCAIEHSLCNLTCVANLDMEFHRWMALVKPYQPFRQPVARNRLACEHCKPAAPEAAQISQRRLSKAGSRQHGLRLAQEDPTILVQDHAASDPVDRWIAWRSSRAASALLTADWVRFNARARRRHMLALCDCDEDAKLLERQPIDLLNGSFLAY